MSQNHSAGRKPSGLSGLLKSSGAMHSCAVDHGSGRVEEALSERVAGEGGSFELSAYLRSSIGPLVIVAHPDDESLGVGGQLQHWPAAMFIHVTDGSPRDLRDAHSAGLKTQADYAALRQRELDSALALAGFDSEARLGLGLIDQEAATNLEYLTRRLACIFLDAKPQAVITHPYEGGHPDHDAVAFAVHSARQQVLLATGLAPMILEMTSYHNEAGWMRTGEFLPAADSPITTLHLNAAQHEFKRRLLRCFPSQSQTLRQFKCHCERFRIAPKYDFTEPPHEGTLFYEQYGLGMHGRDWRVLSAKALASLGIPQ